MKTQAVALTSEGQNSIYSESLSECIKHTSNLKGTVYTNICDGTSHFVPLGFWDYVLSVSLGAILALLVLGLMVGIFRMIFD